MLDGALAAGGLPLGVGDTSLLLSSDLMGATGGGLSHEDLLRAYRLSEGGAQGLGAGSSTEQLLLSQLMSQQQQGGGTME